MHRVSLLATCFNARFGAIPATTSSLDVQKLLVIPLQYGISAQPFQSLYTVLMALLLQNPR